MNKYWFTIYPHCFLWVKGEEGLVYNTQTYAKIRFHNIGVLKKKTELLTAMENLYCIHLTEDELKDKFLNEWIQSMIAQDSGLLVEDNGINKRPLSLPPILKVQDEADYYQWEHKQGIDGNVIDFLHRIIFHINGSKYGNELLAKQILFPVHTTRSLSSDDLIRFAMNSRNSSFLAEISLVGDLPAYKDLEQVIETLHKICPVSLYCTYQDAIASVDKIRKLSAKANLHIIVTGDCTFDRMPLDAIYTFVVTSEQEYETAIKYEQTQKLKHIEIIPVYNANNIHFLEDNLYLDEKDIQQITWSKRDIFIHQKLNIKDFGQLTIMPDGKVYSNPALHCIGNIQEAPHSIVYNEIVNGHSWLRIRNEKPCCNCIYQWLCPPPSHYEDVIGKANLCHI